MNHNKELNPEWPYRVVPPIFTGRREQSWSTFEFGVHTSDIMQAFFKWKMTDALLIWKWLQTFLLGKFVHGNVRVWAETRTVHYPIYIMHKCLITVWDSNWRAQMHLMEKSCLEDLWYFGPIFRTGNARAFLKENIPLPFYVLNVFILQYYDITTDKI